MKTGERRVRKAKLFRIFTHKRDIGKMALCATKCRDCTEHKQHLIDYTKLNGETISQNLLTTLRNKKSTVVDIICCVTATFVVNQIHA